jgi:hypothetical protein
MQNIKRLVADITDRAADDRIVVEALEAFVRDVANYRMPFDALGQLSRVTADAKQLAAALDTYNEAREAASW